MATDSKKSEEKKPGEDGQPPVAEAILASPQRDGDEMDSAEQAIRGFIAARLSDWYNEMESSLDGLEAWVMSQPESDKEVFKSRGYFDSLGDRFLGELYSLAGGKGSPVMDALAGEIDGGLSFAERTEFDPALFINEMRRSVRDACWFVRDASVAVLSNQMPDLLDLAQGGAIDFIPALYTMGLPTRAFNPADFRDKLTAHSDSYRNAISPRKEQAEDKASENTVKEDKKMEAEEEASKLSEEQLSPVRKEAATV